MIKIPEDIIPGTRHMTTSCGELEIVKYETNRKIHVRFVDTGYECVSAAKEIRRGHVKDLLSRGVLGVGYFGIGKFSYIDTKKIYTTWYNMLNRCYNEKEQLRKPAYIGCSVAPIWHNLQAFGEWYEANYPRDGGVYQLDKDIKVKGNKVYSPETCMFVTPAENKTAARAKSYVFLSPDNVRTEIYNMRSFCREHGLDTGSMCMVSTGKQTHHKGWTTTT